MLSVLVKTASSYCSMHIMIAVSFYFILFIFVLVKTASLYCVCSSCSFYCPPFFSSSPSLFPSAASSYFRIGFIATICFFLPFFTSTPLYLFIDFFWDMQSPACFLKLFPLFFFIFLFLHLLLLLLLL